MKGFVEIVELLTKSLYVKIAWTKLLLPSYQKNIFCALEYLVANAAIIYFIQIQRNCLLDEDEGYEVQSRASDANHDRLPGVLMPKPSLRGILMRQKILLLKTDSSEQYKNGVSLLAAGLI